MNLTADYEKLLEDNLKEELEWVVQEFQMLFKQKMLKQCYSKDDISLGNQILDNVIDNIKTNENEELLNLLGTTLNSIEKQFPEFF
ncbi:MAG: hypothetical protein KGD58_03160 [Candidatus Lokiarchaeota archaeon]|nr:hypothetical protein [Candidatus Lokiarchaeota archaeon]